MDDWFDYEAFVFACGGDVSCPECGFGILRPCGEGEAQWVQSLVRQRGESSLSDASCRGGDGSRASRKGYRAAHSFLYLSMRGSRS